jgi:uncharacterized protein (TIGR03083 family)
MADPRPEGAVEGLGAVWASLVALGEDLSADAFDAPTACPGWTVRDQFSHVIGTELLLQGDGAPPALEHDGPHVRNELGALNERFVAARRDLPGHVVVAELAELANRRLAALRELEAEADGARTASAVELVPYVDYVTSRTFDAWVHEQDVRRATGRPGGRGGHAERTTLDRLEASLPYVLGRRVGAPCGTTLRVEVTGPLGRTVQLAVEPDAGGRPRGVATSVIPGRPTAVLCLDQATFVARACGRVSAETARAAPRTGTAGDAPLAVAFLERMVVTA